MRHRRILIRTVKSLMVAWACSASLLAEALPLQLVRKVTVQEIRQSLKSDDAQMQKAIAQWPEEDTLLMFRRDPCGFMEGGKLIHFGIGGVVLDVTSGALVQRYPPDLNYVSYSLDGMAMLASKIPSESVVYVTSKGSTTIPWRISDRFLQRRVAIQPGTGIVAYFSEWDRTEGMALSFFDPLHPKKRFKTIECGLSMNDFTWNGRYLCMNRVDLLDMRTGKQTLEAYLPGFEEMGSADYLITNQDGSWVAGFGGYYDKDGDYVATFIWDRVGKRFVWKGKEMGSPIAFSCNGRYLLTLAGKILHADTAEVAFQGIKGERGKFSPDGRSLVTLDDEAFYIYTLPKDSEPIFGVFQKPAPWSPPRKPGKRNRSTPRPSR